MNPGAESLTVVECCYQEDIFFNIGADVNQWWRETLAKRRCTRCRARFDQAHWRVERPEGDEGRVLGLSDGHAVGASTRMSIPLRRGPGGIQHLNTKQLWVQEAITEKLDPCIAVNREENPADTLKRQGHAAARQDDGL